MTPGQRQTHIDQRITTSQARLRRPGEQRDQGTAQGRGEQEEKPGNQGD